MTPSSLSCSLPPSPPVFDPATINNRRIAHGAACCCGQMWPDYVIHGDEATIECCGAAYRVAVMSDGRAILSRLTPMLGDPAP